MDRHSTVIISLRFEARATRDGKLIKIVRYSNLIYKKTHLAIVSLEQRLHKIFFPYFLGLLVNE